LLQNGVGIPMVVQGTMSVYPTIPELRHEFGAGKIIPPQYERPVLMALAHYPELKNVHIHIVLTKKQNVAYRTLPQFTDIFRVRHNRHYQLKILEQAPPPMEKALLKNCPLQAQVGLLGHELAHVLQFHRRGRLKLFLFLLLYLVKKGRKKIERGADLLTIYHGLGRELYLHAIYIRSIPGYIKKYPSLDDDYLKPEEILVHMQST